MADNFANMFGFGCCSYAGSTIPTPGFELCCPHNPIPDPLSISWTFRGGTSSADYSDFTQNTTLTYYTVGPTWTWTPGVSGPSGSGFYSVVLHSSDGQDFYYYVNCAAGGSGAIGLGIGISGFGPSSCFTFGSFACSPFLASGVAGGVGGVVCGNLGGFGATGDNVVLS
jgi:hypothetical protein